MKIKYHLEHTDCNCKARFGRLDTNYGSYDNLVYINYVSSRGVSSANSARAAAESYSSGGGGFSSGGGGGGSFGGGGGRRRFSLK